LQIVFFKCIKTVGKIKEGEEGSEFSRRDTFGKSSEFPVNTGRWLIRVGTQMTTVRFATWQALIERIYMEKIIERRLLAQHADFTD
jgi:hypothetical protein